MMKDKHITLDHYNKKSYNLLKRFVLSMTSTVQPLDTFTGPISRTNTTHYKLGQDTITDVSYVN